MNDLKKNYTFGDFLFYICLLAVPVVVALLAITRHSIAWTITCVLVTLGLTALILKFYCTRCPHYTREGRKLKCIFFWGLPKFFAPRPGPLNMMDKLVLYLAPTVVVLFPLPWLIKEPGLLLVFVLSLAGFAAAVRRNECHRCIYFACPMNQVTESAKHQYRDETADE